MPESKSKRNDEDDMTPVLSPVTRPSSPAVSAAGPAERPVEEWAEVKGMLPMRLAGAPPGASGINPEYWKFAATRAFKRWQEGQLVTEEQFDTAVAEQLGASHR